MIKHFLFFIVHRHHIVIWRHNKERCCVNFALYATQWEKVAQSNSENAAVLKVFGKWIFSGEGLMENNTMKWHVLKQRALWVQKKNKL